MAQATTSPKLRRMQWVAIALCTMAIAVNYIDRSTLAVGNLMIRQDFQISATAIGALQSAWSIAFAIAQIPVGFMVDRLGSRALLGGGLLLWSAAQAVGGFMGSYVQLIWARAALGVFEAPAFPTAVRVTSNWFQSRDRGRPTGVYTVGGDLGRLIGTPLLTALMLAFGWRVMFVFMGAVGILGAVGWFLLYRDPDKAELSASDRAYLDVNSAGGRPPVTLKQWGRLFRYRTMWGMILGAFCSGYAIWMYGTWLIGYLEMQHHVSIAKTGFLAMIPLFFSIAGSQVGGYVTDRLAHSGTMSIVASRKLPAVAGYIASAICCAIAAMTTEMMPALAAISAAMFSLSFAQSGKWTLITAVAPQSYSASVASIQNFGSYIGGTVSPLLTGFVVDETGSFVLALAIGAGVTFMGAVLYGFIVRDPIDIADLEADDIILMPKAAE
jgi:MFS family permease